MGSRVYPGREDRRTLFADAQGWDALNGPGVDRVINLEAALPDDAGRFAHIECISTLEHTPRPWLVTQNLERLLLPGGTLYLSVPFSWRLHAYPDDFWRFTAAGVRALFTRIAWRAMVYVDHKLHPEEGKTPSIKVEGWPYFPRMEVCAFGVRA